MTYAAFLLVWIVPLVVLLPYLRREPEGGVGGRRAQLAVPLTAAIAFVYTTPWDNYLVYRGVWGYGGADRVMGVVGYVPVEEYLFFLLQPFLTGALLLRVLERTPDRVATAGHGARIAGAVFFGMLSLLGAGLLVAESDRGLYAGLILAWACPVLAGMWTYAGPHLWAYRRALALVLGTSTLYLWIADRYAILGGIWTISDRYSFDVDPFGLPVEEALFFLVTNVLCAFSVLTFLHGDHIRPFWKHDG